MKLRVEGSRIVITGTQYEHRGLYAEIPGSRYNKNVPGHVAPASPFTAMLIMQMSKDNGIPIESATEDFRDLLQEMRLILHKERYKQSDYVLRARQTESVDNWITQTVPWAHQKTAALFCDEMRSAYLAMEMGTGKTLVIVNEILQQIALGYYRFLIMCPKSVLDVWQAEFKKHAPTLEIPVVVLKKGSNKKKMEQILDAKYHCWDQSKPAVVVVNYETAWRDKVGDTILSTAWRMVVLDEAHKIKSPSGKASRFCARLVARSAIRRCLSGTPLPNNQLDAYGQWRFLDPGYFGTNFVRYRARYCQMGGFQNHQIVGWLNQSEFKQRIDYLTFRVDKSVLDLPPTTSVERYCTLPKSARDIYRQVEESFVATLREGTEISMTNVLKRLMKLQQISSGFIIDDEGDVTLLHTEKSKLLEEFLQSIDKDEKVVVFCRFTHDLREVERVSDKCGRMYGELSGRANDLRGGELVDPVQVLGTQIQAGGIGVNLTAARYCVYYSVGYSLSDYLQAEARVHRGGQDRPVTYIKLIAEETIDQRVYQALADKKEVVDEILDYIKREGV